MYHTDKLIKLLFVSILFFKNIKKIRARNIFLVFTVLVFTQQHSSQNYLDLVQCYDYVLVMVPLSCSWFQNQKYY